MNVLVSRSSNKKLARQAGLWYLVVVLTGMFSLAYVPARLIDWNDATATFNNLVAGQALFRLGIVSGLVCYTAFVFLPLALYRLLSPVHERLARLMVVLALVSVPISFVNLLNKLAALSLTGGDAYLSAWPREQLVSQVMFYLNQYDNGLLIVQIFWGLWLLPLGLLVFKSGFLPKALGVVLVLGCCGYLINFLGFSLFPQYAELGISAAVRLPASLGEIGTCLWLLIVGARSQQNDEEGIRL